MNQILKFNNTLELLTYFKDEAACRLYLERIFWDGKPVCPHCGNEKYYRLAGGKKLKCADCKSKYSVTAGTIFDSSKIPLQKWFLAMYVASSHKKGISSCQMAKDIGVSKQTAWYMIQRIMEGSKEMESVVLTGTVQVDETYIGGKPKRPQYLQMQLKQPTLKISKQDKLALTKPFEKPKAPILALLQERGKVVATHIPVTDIKMVHTDAIIQSHIEQGSKIITDESSLYRSLKYDGYTHRTVNHKAGEYVATDGTTTNHVEGFFSFFKWTIEGAHKQVSKKHLQAYADAISFRYNTRHMQEGERFEHLMHQCNRVLRYKTLVNRPKNG